MIQILLNLNWIAVIVSAITYFIFGGLWFLPSVLGKQNDDALGFVRPATWKPTSNYFTVPFLTCLLTSIGISVLLNGINPKSIFEAFILGLILGIAFALPVSLVNSINPKIAKPTKYGLITGIYHIIGIILSTIIIYKMTK